MFGSGFVLLGLCMIAEAVVGRGVWRRRAWRGYLIPSLLFATGLFLWPVTVFFTSSTMHMLAHLAWAEFALLAGAAQLGLVRGKLKHPLWELTVPLALAVGGSAFLIHEQNPWLFSRAAFLHHAIGWTLVIGSLFPLASLLRPRSLVLRAGLGMTVLALAFLLLADRDVAPIFGHLSDLAGEPRR